MGAPATPAAAGERHEFLVTYEGPSHPSSGPPCRGSRKTFTVTLPSSPGADYVSSEELLQSLAGRIGWPSSLLCIAGLQKYDVCSGGDVDVGAAARNSNGARRLFPSHSITCTDGASAAGGAIRHQHPSLTVAIAPQHSSIRGGKGGFGTLLKGQSKKAGARTTVDFGACRDLSGRRLRHVNDEIKLRKFREMQEKKEKGEEVDELAAIKTPSGIRNWHLMVPGWSDAAMTNKGRRKIERQMEREVRGYKSREERARMAKEEKRRDEEWAANEYVKRGEVEGGRSNMGSEDVKQGILEHFRKRKAEKEGEVGGEAKAAAASVGDKTAALLENAPESGSLAAHLMTLAGEMSVFDFEQKADKSKAKLRMQSQSDFATAVVVLDAEKLKGAETKGVYVEYTLQTAGLAQIGWIRPPAEGRKAFLPNSDTGDGVGDDGASFGYDGSRRLKFHDGTEVAYGIVSDKPVEWKAGDVLGCYCKLSLDDKIEMGYSLNGTDLGVAFSVLKNADSFGYYPAVSLNLNEVVDVNVGPDFAFEIKDGCVGACDLVKTEVDAENEPAGASSKGNDTGNGAKEDATAPPRKRPREPETNQNGKKDEMKTETSEKKTAEAFDLNQCSSVDELMEMNPERLKNILLSMGVKCGGTPEERAKRLFSLKGLRRDEYPQKVRGKNFVP
ncbi:hypothetical protein ACHAXT_005495 [Thalassiosira profunda]